MFLRVVILLGSLLVTFAVSFGGLILLQPEWLFSRLRRRSPEVLYAVDTQERIVALTIDDGPDAGSTPAILDVLAKYDAQATFFIISEHLSGNDTLVQRMLAEGHELGNHLTADEPSIRLPIAEFEAKLVQADVALSEFGEVRWMRPGSGWYNDEMLAVIAEHGYRCALGSVYPYDPQLGSAWFAARYVLWKIKPGDVIVLHDYQARGLRTAKALDIILPELQLRGFRTVTLSELVK